MTKRCAKCGHTKPIDEFVRDRQRSDGRYPYCKACHRANVKGYAVEHTAEMKEQRAIRKAHRDANHEAREKYLLGNWIYSLKRRYGVTAEDYIALVKAQDNRCAICGERPANTNTKDRTLHIDHCHTTGAVRGLLCFRCNTGLGSFRDDPRHLRAAVKYLAR